MGPNPIRLLSLQRGDIWIEAHGEKMCHVKMKAEMGAMPEQDKEPRNVRC